ncbi:hypothetical protein BUALT_Bualt19G0099900 [Buddleja alternifolia]|uniref:SCP domain-containing protein n=1 Tax=Buddleja alternifolia TaxID=168488 RepID=A0AAV6W6Z5_9LAMI|nr:hypothetical protein BUALT_Bualt19G0099900 [Buddleja alternifolia]
MGSTKVPVILVCLMMALTQLTTAQKLPEDYVNAHTPARAEVGVQPLVWDETVAAYAQNYANERSKDCAMQHSGGPYGENLAAGSWDLTAKQAMDMWVGEKNFYDVASNTCVGGQCLHYTQVVWRNSTSVGCASAKCLNGWTFITCNYDPPGNYIGERPY